jgi:hypothetical protein
VLGDLALEPVAGHAVDLRLVVQDQRAGADRAAQLAEQLQPVRS